MYAFPFDLVADRTEEPSIRLPEDRVEAGAECLRLTLEAYGGDWLRHVPAGLLAVNILADILAARARLKRDRDRRRTKAKEAAGASASVAAAFGAAAVPAGTPSPG